MTSYRTEHKHHHGETQLDVVPLMQLEFEAHCHEGAAVVSCALHPRESCALSFSRLVKVLEEVAAALEAKGAFIGHVKAVVTAGDATATASITDTVRGAFFTGNEHLVLAPGTQCQAVAIVMGISLEDALAIFRSCMTESLL